MALMLSSTTGEATTMVVVLKPQVQSDSADWEVIPVLV
jgi:hypothetical protein